MPPRDSALPSWPPLRPAPPVWCTLSLPLLPVSPRAECRTSSASLPLSPCKPFPAHSGHVVLSSASARRGPRGGNLPSRYAGSRDGDCIRRIRRSSVTPCAGVSSVVRFVVPTWGPSLPYATRVAAPRASAVLPSHPRPVCPGTPAHRPGPPGGPMLLRAIAPCSLFCHTMATLVVPLVSLLRAPSDWGCL